MKKDLIIIENNEPYVGTWTLSEGFGVEHRSLTRLMKKYLDEFEELSFDRAATRLRPVVPKQGGASFDEYLLCEEQAIYITTLLTNTSKVRKFKMYLSKEFMRQRRFINKLIVQKQNADWLEKRKAGKIDRRVETDAIKEFIEYAKAQGSQNAPKYYMAISKMENKSLFLNLMAVDFPKLRDAVSGISLTKLQMADRIVAKALKEGMEQNTYYKEIFLLAKARVESFADLVGKDEILIEQQKVIQ